MSIHPGMMVYKNRDQNKPVIKTEKDYSTGDLYESSIWMNLHTGTHMDAPLHMIEQGDTLDGLNLNQVIRKCKVLDFTNIADHITDTDLSGEDIRKDDFLILKTRNSYQDYFEPNFVYLDKMGARYLKDQEISGVGIDSLGIERDQPEHDTHKILFETGIFIVEGLRLKGIEAGEYFLFAAPVKINNTEASPVRAVLVKGIEIVD
jgi:arylformamidase